MRKFDDDDFFEPLNQVQIEDFLSSEAIEYRRTKGSRGTQLNLQTCPVCGSNKWKVYLNAETGLGNCFSGSCETKFNKLSFLKAQLGFGAREVIDYLRSKTVIYGIKPRRIYEKAKPVDHTGLKLPQSYRLPIGSKSLGYLADRNIDIDTQVYFDLRYCHDGFFAYDFEGTERRMDFSKRVIIPIRDLEGRIVSFQGRDITGTADKKYLFPPGYAATGQLLFNGHNAIESRRIVVGEGVFDVMAIHMALQKAPTLREIIPVATFGKHLSSGDAESQLSKFMYLQDKGLREVTMMWDAEKAALDAAIQASKALSSIGLIVRIAVLPPGKDPNEVEPSVIHTAITKALTASPANLLKLKCMTL